ncbi:hypothetical protein NAEGRDRAFT_48624 [Naegleria gruberi]|uniref:Uncharacterized protein AM16 n=1 Tax=Naegleria gruberi TaxID=5762 RepID=D2VDJ4_NAEGR|nr:uncharacterized protein NAEGRDRAFT_48624 [Naegleria gruberi]EFC45151.1 hypothetical protein NAEGRDRAFT_48624 [Naegleria gruberi]|eukprot:XP_002677895.1 hypothetical protein NAEGRDRAFT_48624 [Naegleria gruberi strain NEG-M]
MPVIPSVIPTVADVVHSPISPIRLISKDDTHIITNTGSLSPVPQMARHASSPSSLAHTIPFVPSQLESLLPPSLPQIFKQLIPSEIKMMSEKEKEEWSSMITKVIVSFCYAMFAIFCTSVTMVVVHERVPKDYPPLPDIILDNLPLIPSAFAISEFICVVLGLIVFFILVIHKHRGIIFRRVLVIIASVFLLRCITMFITSLSVPGTHLTASCMATRGMTTTFDDKLKRALEITFGFGMSIMNVKTCGDYMFSGHMSMITILNYTINEYTPKHWKGLHIITWVLNCFGAFFVLAAHEHYSIDVFIGFFISSRLFVYYHDTANMRHILNLHNIETTAYIPLFDYMEDTVDGVVKNEFIISVGEKDHRHRPLHSLDPQTIHTLQEQQQQIASTLPTEQQHHHQYH